MAQWNTRVPIAKLDAEKHRAFGWASVITDEHGKPILDHQEHEISVDELEQAAYNYVAESRGVNVDVHFEVPSDPPAKLIETFVLTPEKSRAMDLPEKGSAWWVGFDVAPKIWPRIESGELAEISIGGSGVPVPILIGKTRARLTDLVIDELVLCDKGAGKGVRIMIAKRRTPIAKGAKNMADATDAGPSRTVDDILAELPEDDRNIILAAIQAAAQGAQGTLPAPPPPSLPSAIAKTLSQLPKEVREHFEADARERVVLAKKLADAEDAMLTREYNAKAEKLANIPGVSTSELGSIMKAIERGQPVPQEIAVKFGKTLESANAMLGKSSLFRESGAVAAMSGGAEQKAVAIAKTLRSTDGKLSDAQALARAFEQNPDLYDEYLRETGRGNRARNKAV